MLCQKNKIDVLKKDFFGAERNKIAHVITALAAKGSNKNV
jgi:hypothetical protein